MEKKNRRMVSQPKSPDVATGKNHGCKIVGAHLTFMKATISLSRWLSI